MWRVFALAALLQLCCCHAPLTSARRVPFIPMERSVAYAAAWTSTNDALDPPQGLPVFFFHGITGYPEEAVHLEKALAAEGRALVALSFCPRQCSTQSLLTQVPMAVAQVRSIVATDQRFQGGYVFIGHSQGGIMARAVIEDMDDHRVHTFISLAGVQNGVFYGPQVADRVPLQILLAGFGQQLIPRSVFDFNRYLTRHEEDARTLRGEIQRDLCVLSDNEPKLEDEYSFVNLARFPAFDEWVRTNKFLPELNNVNVCNLDDLECEQDKQRRKRNFTTLKTAHFFASPNDGVVAPWQISIFSRYSEVSMVDEIESKFEELTIVGMRDTLEYANDTFGLRTLDERGSLFLHQVQGVAHGCWVHDCWRSDDPTQFCEWQPNYDRHVYPLLS